MKKANRHDTQRFSDMRRANEGSMMVLLHVYLFSNLPLSEYIFVMI